MNLNITILILEKDSFPKCSYYFVFVPSLKKKKKKNHTKINKEF